MSREIAGQNCSRWRCEGSKLSHCNKEGTEVGTRRMGDVDDSGSECCHEGHWAHIDTEPNKTKINDYGLATLVKVDDSRRTFRNANDNVIKISRAVVAVRGDRGVFVVFCFVVIWYMVDMLQEDECDEYKDYQFWDGSDINEDKLIKKDQINQSKVVSKIWAMFGKTGQMRAATGVIRALVAKTVFVVEGRQS